MCTPVLSLNTLKTCLHYMLCGYKKEVGEPSGSSGARKKPGFKELTYSVRRRISFFLTRRKNMGNSQGALAWNRAHFFSFFFNTLPIHTINNSPHENFRHQKKAPVLVGIARREAKGRVVSLLFVSLRVSSASFFRFVSRGRRTEKIGK